LSRIVSDCANATSKQGFEYFGIQFYGECWSGVSKIAYDAVGKSDNCKAGAVPLCKAARNGELTEKKIVHCRQYRVVGLSHKRWDRYL
ncbi:unnamed protein product, partial [Porites evermanni]